MEPRKDGTGAVQRLGGQRAERDVRNLCRAGVGVDVRLMEQCVCALCACICHVLLSSQLGFSSCSMSKGKCHGSSMPDFSSHILPVFVPFSSAELS